MRRDPGDWMILTLRYNTIHFQICCLDLSGVPWRLFYLLMSIPHREPCLIFLSLHGLLLHFWSFIAISFLSTPFVIWLFASRNPVFFTNISVNRCHDFLIFKGINIISWFSKLNCQWQFQKHTIGARRNGSAVRSACCFLREAKFNFQSQVGQLITVCNSSSKGWNILFWPPYATHTHKQTCMHAHTQSTYTCRHTLQLNLGAISVGLQEWELIFTHCPIQIVFLNLTRNYTL